MGGVKKGPSSLAHKGSSSPFLSLQVAIIYLPVANVVAMIYLPVANVHQYSVE